MARIVLLVSIQGKDGIRAAPRGMHLNAEGYRMGSSSITFTYLLSCFIFSSQTVESSQTVGRAGPQEPASAPPAAPSNASTSVSAKASANLIQGSVAKPEGSFLSALLPGSVSYNTETRTTLVGEIQHNTARSKIGGTSLSITASKLPSFVTNVLTEPLIQRKARNELLRALSASALTWQEGQHAGYPCRTLTYETNDGRRGIAQFYVHEGVLVVLNALYEEEQQIALAFLETAK